MMTALHHTMIPARNDSSVSNATHFGEAIGESESMRRLFALLERAAGLDVSILFEGESGVGKDVLARSIHQASNRADGPFIALDCGAIPTNLIESELFGHERGAFTGADRAREGAFALADGGTLFLDEIGELPLEMQPKLLRALETRMIRPIGGNRTRNVNVRIVAATNRNLSEGVETGEFRRDLFYRLAVLRVCVPALRDRKEDILPLARTFLNETPGFEDALISPELESLLVNYRWPGNVRELRNVVRRYALLGADINDLFDETLGGGGRPAAANDDDLSHLSYEEARAIALERFEMAYLPGVLARNGNVVTQAAKHAGVRRGSFHRMLRRIKDRTRTSAPPPPAPETMSGEG